MQKLRSRLQTMCLAILFINSSSSFLILDCFSRTIEEANRCQPLQHFLKLDTILLLVMLNFQTIMGRILEEFEEGKNMIRIHCMLFFSIIENKNKNIRVEASSFVLASLNKICCPFSSYSTSPCTYPCNYRYCIIQL